MLKWKVNRTIDLTRDAPAVERLKALATLSTRIAHELRIGVQESKKDADLSGLTAKLSVILPDKSSLMDAFDGRIDGSAAVMTLPDICYSQTGEVRGVLYLADDDGGLLPIYAFVLLNFADLTDVFIDTANVVPSISELLAQMQTMREVTAAAQTATQNANTAAANADNKAAAADTAAEKANTAAEAIDGWVNATATVEMLNADAAPVVTITDQDTGKQLHFALPRGLTGLTPKLQIGTITTLEEGQQATATITGTAEAPVLNLAIPRGATGNVDGLTYFDTTPAGLGAASPGTSGAVARGDHVHPMPSAADVKALPDTGQALHTFKDTTSENADFWGLEQKVTGIAGEYGALGIRFFPGEAVRIARGIDGAYQSYKFYDEANKPTADDVGALAKEATAADSAKLGGVAAGQYALKNNIPAAYTLPAATASTLGGVKAGGGMSVASDGTLSGMQFVQILPIATYSTGATLTFSQSPYTFTHFFGTLNYCGTGFARMSGSAGQRSITFHSMTCSDNSMLIRVVQINEASAMDNNWTLTRIQQYFISVSGDVDLTQPTSTQLGVYGIKAY